MEDMDVAERLQRMMEKVVQEYEEAEKSGDVADFEDDDFLTSNE